MSANDEAIWNHEPAADEDVNGDTTTAVIQKKLCTRCCELELSEDKFVIHDGGFTSHPKQAQARGKSQQTNRSSLKSGTGYFELGTFNDIERRSSKGCPICSLVMKSTVSYSCRGPGSLTATCFINWEIDGRDIDPFSGRKARTRRLHLHWDDSAYPDSYLVYVAPQRLFDFNSDSKGSWEKEAFFLGREMKRDGDENCNQVLMKSWVDQCSLHHGTVCQGREDGAFADMASQSYFGVIDVLDMCLKSLPLRAAAELSKAVEREPYRRRSPSPPNAQGRDIYEPYVALSYVWGQKQTYTTKLSNVRVHQQQASLETFLYRIPKVIRDAMDLVRRLGLRYLWVDSICIVQDSKRSWNLNARMMNVIYGNAFLTICAADGADAWAGLKALGPAQWSTTQHIEECVPGVRLMVSNLAETGISSSVWNSRGWTFQERLLSKRCLIFTEGKVFFQCRSATMSEDLVSESRGAGWSLDLAKALPQILHELKSRPIRVYLNCIERYSRRQLTKSTDILAAFNGVSNLISDVMKAPFIFGLPTSHFDLALLWEAQGSVIRRLSPSGEDFGDFVAPSWSWCGFMSVPGEERKFSMSYRSSQLDGVFINVHEWLIKHTWIAWYIRDGRGNLRPIWDGLCREYSKPGEERWEGYPAVAFPDGRLEGLQIEALKNLSDEGEDDFIKWAKEQEVAAKERERISHVRKEYYDRPQGGKYDRHQRRGHEEYYGDERAIIRESYPRRHRSHSGSDCRSCKDSNDDVYRDVHADDVNDQETLMDEYGRSIRMDIAKRVRNHFLQCLPDNPFRVNIESYTSEPDQDFPDQPLLQFWTWWAPLQLAKSTTSAASVNLSNHITGGASAGQMKYDISDNSGDWCGSILLDSSWIAAEEKRGRIVDGSKRDFLAISDAKAFTKEECEVWTYYVPKEREASEWDLYYVLLVEMRERIWYRVALGKVFKQSFDNAVGGRKQWREIIMG